MSDDYQEIETDTWCVKHVTNRSECGCKLKQQDTRVLDVIDAFQESHDLITSELGETLVLPKDGHGPRIARPLTRKTLLGSFARERMTTAWHTAAKPAVDFMDAMQRDTERVQVHLRFTNHLPGAVVLDLGQEGNSKCVVVTGDGWTIEPESPLDVIFHRPPSQLALPDPMPGGTLEPLADLLGLDPDSGSFVLLRGWLACAPFASIPRPMLFLSGAQGSAKTTRGQFLLGLLDPKPAGVIGGSFGKKLSDDQVKLLSQALFGYDNLDRISSEQSDHISRAVTGELAENKKLYTDKESVQIAYRRTGVMTGLVLARGIKADALDRIIHIECPEVTRRYSEEQLIEQFQTARPLLLGSVLDDIVTILSELPAVRESTFEPERMADYSQRLHALGARFSQEFTSQIKTLKIDQALSSPFVAAVTKWLLANITAGGLEVKSSEAFKACYAQFVADESARGAFPKDSAAFVARLKADASLLKTSGYEVAQGRTSQHRTLIFTAR